MARLFVTSDLHFGHRKAAQFRGFASVDEHDRHLIDRWSSVVTKRDTVWVLGDAAFGRAYLPIFGQLPGIKKLVMGNHDRFPTHYYLDYFNVAVGAVRLHECILTHIPVHPDQFHRYRANIHGHTHAHCLDDPRYMNVSVEQTDYTPVRLESLLDRLSSTISDLK